MVARPRAGRDDEMITDKQRKLIKDIEDAAINTMPVFAKLDYIEPMSAAIEGEFARLNGEMERMRDWLQLIYDIGFDGDCMDPEELRKELMGYVQDALNGKPVLSDEENKAD